MGSNTPNPLPLDENTARKLTANTVSKVKNLDCRMYSDCLDQADSGDWPGFGCHSCTAYEMFDQEQLKSDVEALLTTRMAAKNVVELGCANRKRGVKAGSQKSRLRLPVIMDRVEGRMGGDLAKEQLRLLVIG